MDAGIISMRYAKALLGYAEDTKSEDSLYAEMTLLAAAYRRFPDFRTVLDNPVLNEAEKTELLKSATGGKPSGEYLRFVQLVLRHKRENHLQTMALLFIDLYRKKKHIVVGSLTTATPVDQQTEERMRKVLLQDQEGTLEFSTHVDPEILGGFVFDYDTYRLDASIATQLKRIKNQLLEKNRKTD